jgi:hypothetical protein
VEQADGQDLGRLIELREDARDADPVSHERLPIRLVVRRVERGQELVGPMDEDQAVEREPALAQLVVELDVRLADPHPRG